MVVRVAQRFDQRRFRLLNGVLVDRLQGLPIRVDRRHIFVDRRHVVRLGGRDEPLQVIHHLLEVVQTGCQSWR